MTGTTDKSIGWVGSLHESPLPGVLRKIAMEERSGDFQVIAGRTIKTVYFDRGFVVFAASNLKRDRLGESMIELGRISRHQFAIASLLMKNSRRKFGQALVQAGLMSEEELGRQVALQVNRILLSLFKVRDGIYSFDERPCIIPVELMVSLSIYRILLDGVRFLADEDLIRSGLPSMKTRVRVAQRPPFTINVRKLRPVEQDVLRAAGKGVSLESIARRLPQERKLILRACYGLYSAGLLEPIAVPARPLKVQEETGSFLLSEIQQKFAKIQATNIRQEILMEFDRLERIPVKEFLKVDHQASRRDVRKAYEAEQRRWEKRRQLVEDERSMVSKVDDIQDRLNRAYGKLMMEREQTTTASPQPPSGPTPSPALVQALAQASRHVDVSTNPKAVVKPNPIVEPKEAVPPSVTTKPVVEQQQEAPPPPATELPPLDEALIEEVTMEGTPSSLHSRPDSAVRDDTQPGLEDESTPESPSSTVPGGADRPAIQYTESQRRARIQQLFRDVKLHFQVRDWEGAVSLLYELVKLAPDSPDYHGMLARAMARHPVMRKDAERHFIKALRIAPQSADLHFSLGLYYKSFGMKSRAETEFRTVLRIQPSHEGARKHLLSRRRKDPLRDMFRKIFG